MDAVKDNDVASNPALSAVITDGAVSGVLPHSESFAVNYPGYPISVSRAVDTLGGLDDIARVRSSDSSQLELRFRPEDPYCHPAFGERRAFTGLLLKISKLQLGSDGERKEQLSAEVVARVNEAYHFEGMVDYQHVLPVHAAEARRKKRRCVFDEETELDEEADVMMLVPPLFSLKNCPEEIVLNPSSNLFSRNLQKNVVEHRWEMDIEPCLAIDFTIEKVPQKVNWEDNVPKGTTEWELQSAISKLFETRPIWPRRSIHEQLLDDGLHVTTHLIKRFLFRSGYYFATGPFGQFWIRKGYDPRKDPESRKFQRIDFRVPLQLRTGSTANIDAKANQTWKSICQLKVFPWKNFSSLQLFELVDDYIQDEIRKPTDQTICTRQRGWFSDIVLKTLRLRVSIRFLSICPKEDAEIFLQCYHEEFERCKKQETLRKYRKSVTNKNVNQDSDMSSKVACAESNAMEHQLLGQDDPTNCNIENDEEEEEEEEELDTYESPVVEGDGNCFSPETTYQAGDTITNDYLQDLMLEFPFSKDGSDSRSNREVEDADLSDGEFQIYEQDSEDSDEDDVS